MAEGRPGSEGQSLAYFLNMEDVANGALQFEGANYAAMAKVWDKYCSKRYKSADGTMNPYGKSVARTVFIGEPKQGKRWREGHATFPLHTCPCDVCLFLVSVARKDRQSSNPYGALDLKSIHEYFASKIVAKDIVGVVEDDPEPESDEEPDYQPLSPAVDVGDVETSESSDDEPVEPAPQPVVVAPSQKAKHRAEKRKREKSGGMAATAMPKVLFSDQIGKERSADQQRKKAVQTFVPGELEW